MFKFYFAFILFKVISCDYKLSVVHFNDFHARYEPIDKFSTTCEGQNCIGGFSKLYSQITKLKTENPDSIILNAGDNFQGTLWYLVYKWNVTQHFLNKLPLDAITLGNHEFDDGISNLIPFLKHIQAPVVVSNLNSSLEPQIQNLYKKSIIIEKQNKKIGVIGVLTTSTKSTSHTGNVILEDESQSVNEEAKNLETQVFTNIVLSHCGYEVDLEIAKNSKSKISVIVGGHTDTFLYTGEPTPGPDKPSGPYPTIVLNKNNQKVLVVQASAYTKYLGNLSVIYNDFGEIIRWEGAPIFLGPQVSSDGMMDIELGEWKKKVDLLGKKVVGNTDVTMKKKPCREEECLLGNFVTDAMIFNYSGEKNSCGNLSLAMIHAGGMRAGIDKGNITFNQLITTFPFQDSINICEILGRDIREILESVIDDKHLAFPHLLQLSGLKVVYNISKPENSRIQSLEFCCDNNETIICENLDLDVTYRVFLPTFLTDSNFNPLFQKYIKNKIIGDRDTDVYEKYLKIKSPISPKKQNRIVIIQ